MFLAAIDRFLPASLRPKDQVIAGSGMCVFTDPQAYQAAVRPAKIEVLVTAKGDFHAELTRVDLPRLWIQRGRERLPRIVHSAVSAERPPIFFLASADQAATHHSGMNVSFGEIIWERARSTHHIRSCGPCYWGTMSLPREDLAAAGHALVGRDVTAPRETRRLRPATHLISRLLSLHETAGRLAEGAPHILAQPETARALEQALVHALVMCLADDSSVEIGVGARRHSGIIARFEEFLAENHDRPVYLGEICAAIGVLERTLRICCQEHVGMGPTQYLWLRRMHLARRALIRATPGTTTVAVIAMDHGFWELGRFAVRYRALFGESPSATLRGAPDDRQASQPRPLSDSVQDSETV
jgi:AraC-like DNA-binding protein